MMVTPPGGDSTIIIALSNRDDPCEPVTLQNQGMCAPLRQGAFLLKKSLVKHTGVPVLNRDEFMIAIERMGLNLPAQMYITLYERNCDKAGMVDVDAFCKKIVTY